MIKINLTDFLESKNELILKNGFCYLSANHSFSEFKTFYLRARDVEKRVYFHHTFTDLESENYTILYQPGQSFLKKVFR